ncbi:Alpha-amylase precursor [Legionella birminghamensis]|uniref:Alpha-amylase n=1 Tax=Legionella birminghamensis TaxID=28083 RepID=A0A378I7C5_9GAMM|nr:alpha-amylase family protein [Legionella birminghamensis]KTC68352.1 Alpha-amylase precursor [Legionella birminghamensis]STX30933.1 Alpha-amylase precursor [Legionella birminghamensis]
MYKWMYCFIIFCSFLGASNYNWASAPGNKKVTVTLFQWPLADVAKECARLGKAGYGYVEISPVQEHIRGPQWWTSYQPVSYQIAGRLGDEEAFRNMVAQCHAAGVKVIADVVVNHMTRGYGVGTNGTRYSKYDYPGTYQVQDFHWCRSNINDYSNRDNVQSCELDSLADLDTGSDYVRGKIAEFLNHLIALNVDGFRIDAAKHVSAEDLGAIRARLSKNIFWVQEVIYSEGEAVHPEEYRHLGDLDEFRYGRDLKRIFEREKLAYLKSFGESWGYLPSDIARSFIDNWDTERNSSSLTYKDGDNYLLANIFMLAHPYGSPNVYSGYRFNHFDAGPPVTKVCSRDWVCQHRIPAIANMVKFYNAVQGEPLSDWWSNENNAIAFGRGNKGFVVINHEDYTITETFKTSLPEGVYTDVIHGNSFSVDKAGRFTATVESNDALALYAALALQ